MGETSLHLLIEKFGSAGQKIARIGNPAEVREFVQQNAAITPSSESVDNILVSLRRDLEDLLERYGQDGDIPLLAKLLTVQFGAKTKLRTLRTSLDRWDFPIDETLPPDWQLPINTFVVAPHLPVEASEINLGTNIHQGLSGFLEIQKGGDGELHFYGPSLGPFTTVSNFGPILTPPIAQKYRLITDGLVRHYSRGNT